MSDYVSYMPPVRAATLTITLPKSKEIDIEMAVTSVEFMQGTMENRLRAMLENGATLEIVMNLY